MPAFAGDDNCFTASHREVYWRLEGVNMDENEVMAKWNEIRTLVETLELDIVKNAKGTAAAGVRARKGLRTLKTRASELVKLTVERDKTSKPEKAA